MSYFTRLIGSLGFGKPATSRRTSPRRLPLPSRFKSRTGPSQRSRHLRRSRETKNTPVTDAVTPAKSARRRKTGLGWWWTFAAALILAGVVIVAIAQNSRTVRVHYIVWQSNVSLIVVVLTTALVAILLDQAGGLIWRRRRRARLSRRDELADLRTQHSPEDGTRRRVTRAGVRLHRLRRATQHPVFLETRTGSRGMQANEPSAIPHREALDETHSASAGRS